jgi:hypothetical protein
MQSPNVTEIVRFSAHRRPDPAPPPSPPAAVTAGKP